MHERCGKPKSPWRAADLLASLPRWQSLAYCSGLENRRGSNLRGFKSYSRRQFNTSLSRAELRRGVSPNEYPVQTHLGLVKRRLEKADKKGYCNLGTAELVGSPAKQNLYYMRIWRNGRRAAFRPPCRKACGFESHFPHQALGDERQGQKRRQVGSPDWCPEYANTARRASVS